MNYKREAASKRILRWSINVENVFEAMSVADIYSNLAVFEDLCSKFYARYYNEEEKKSNCQLC